MVLIDKAKHYLQGIDVKKISKNRVIWFTISLLTFILFVFATPFPLFLYAPFITTIIQSLLVIFFLTMGLLDLETVGDLVDYKSREDENPLLIFIPVLSQIICWLALYFILHGRIDAALKEEGIVTQATVTDGSMLTRQSIRRRNSISDYYIKVTFKDTVNMRTRHVTTEVDAKVYERVGKGMIINIIYLKSDPTILKALITSEDIKKFTNIDNRCLQLRDIEYLLQHNTKANIAYLKSISFPWRNDTMNNFLLLENTATDESILMSEEEGIIHYIGTSKDSFMKDPEMKKIEGLSDSLYMDNKLVNIEYYDYKQWHVLLRLEMTSDIEGLLKAVHAREIERMRASRSENKQDSKNIERDVPKETLPYKGEIISITFSKNFVMTNIEE